MTPLGPPFRSHERIELEHEVFASYLSVFGAMAVDRLNGLEQARGAKIVVAGPLAARLSDRLTTRSPRALLTIYEPLDGHAQNLSDPSGGARALAQLPLPDANDSFTHAVLVHPICGARDRLRLLAEFLRVLRPGGELAFASPLRGSYPEITDMLREFALKHDQPKLTEAIELAAQSRPTPETLIGELETLGFIDADLDVELLSIPYSDGKRFAESALFRHVVSPEYRAAMEGQPEAAVQGLDYARGAISKYWSDGPFDLTVNLGCVSARRR